jgi:hypothetical protein
MDKNHKKPFCKNECHLSNKKILYCPFSYRDLGKELIDFVIKVFPYYDKIVSKRIFTEKEVSELFELLIPDAKKFVLDNPYSNLGFDKIFTLVRADGEVTIDITSADLNAIMVQIEQKNQDFSNIKVIRSNSKVPIKLDSSLNNINIYSTIKVYSNKKIDLFNEFTTRVEFIKSSTECFGFSSRPAIYVIGQLYCVATMVTFSSGIQAFFRVSYLRKP